MKSFIIVLLFLWSVSSWSTESFLLQGVFNLNDMVLLNGKRNYNLLFVSKNCEKCFQRIPAIVNESKRKKIPFYVFSNEDLWKKAKKKYEKNKLSKSIPSALFYDPGVRLVSYLNLNKEDEAAVIRYEGGKFVSKRSLNLSSIDMSPFVFDIWK